MVKNMRTLRIDVSVLSTQKLHDTLKKYAKKGKVRYCFVTEEATHTGKQHNQGWYIADSKKDDDAVYKKFQRLLEGTTANSKALPEAREPENHVAYLLNNTNKPKPSYGDVFTDYTEAEYNQFQEHKQFVEKRPHKLKAGKKPKSNFAWLYDIVQKECVDDHIIDYAQILPTLMENLHCYNQIDPFQIKKIAYSITLKLEHKFPQNTKARSSIYRAVCELDNVGLFQNDSFAFKKYKPNKKDAVQKEDDTEAEEVSEEESHDCFDKESDSQD